MKISTFLLLGTLVGVVIVLVPWVLTFHGALSEQTADWSAFGGYFGGVLSPIIATLALIAFLKTIKQQEAQIESLREQSVKEDIWRAIEKIEKDFEVSLRRYPIKIHTKDNTYELSGFDLAFNATAVEYKQAMVNTAELLKALEEKNGIDRHDARLLGCEMFSIAAGELNQLRIFVEKYDEVAGNNAMTKYFQRKYKVPYARFVERGYLDKLWE